LPIKDSWSTCTRHDTIGISKLFQPLTGKLRAVFGDVLGNRGKFPENPFGIMI
jgi:hypothetical protein